MSKVHRLYIILTFKLQITDKQLLDSNANVTWCRFCVRKFYVHAEGVLGALISDCPYSASDLISTL